MRVFCTGLLLVALAATAAQAQKACIIGGCSSQLCIEEGESGVSNCMWTERYRCYQAVGTCERQADGKCGWTPTQALEECFRKADTTLPPGVMRLK